MDISHSLGFGVDLGLRRFLYEIRRIGFGGRCHIWHSGGRHDGCRIFMKEGFSVLLRSHMGSRTFCPHRCGVGQLISPYSYIRRYHTPARSNGFPGEPQPIAEPKPISIPPSPLTITKVTSPSGYSAPLLPLFKYFDDSG